MKYISKKTYQNYARKVEKEIMRENGWSISASTIIDGSETIIEIRDGVLICPDNWKTKMKEYAEGRILWYKLNYNK